MRQLFTIATNSFTEVIRQPVYLIILGCSLALILLSPYFTMFVLLENNKMVKDMGLSTILLTGLLLAAFSASNIIYKEIENRTILTIISKPVSRTAFILGKYLGLIGGLFVAEYILTMVFTHVVRTDIHEAAYSDKDYPVFIGYILAIVVTLIVAAFNNFFYEKNFISSAVFTALPVFTLVFLVLCVIDNEGKFQRFVVDEQILLASLSVFLAVAVLAGFATAFSTRLNPAVSLFLCLTVFLLGLFSDYLFGKNGHQYLFYKGLDFEKEINEQNVRKVFAEYHIEISQENIITEVKDGMWRLDGPSPNFIIRRERDRLKFYRENRLSAIIYRLVPNFQIYWMADAVTGNRRIPLDYFQYIIGYTILLLAAILSGAICLFEEKEAQ